MQPTVLVVEDEWLLRWALAQKLASAGYKVVEAGDAREALAQFDVQPDAVDAVLLDLRLPDADGMSVLQHVKAVRPACPVIIMTAHGSAENAGDALAAGASCFLTKPFDHEAMLALLGDVIDGKA